MKKVGRKKRGFLRHGADWGGAQGTRILMGLDRPSLALKGPAPWFGVCVHLLGPHGYYWVPLPISQRTYKQHPSRGLRPWESSQGSLISIGLRPQPLVDGQPLKILNLCARIWFSAWMRYRGLPLSWPRQISPGMGMAAARPKMPQGVCLTPTLPKLMARPLCRWRVTAVTDSDRVGEAGWGVGQGTRSWWTGPREAHPRKMWLCRSQRF